MTVIEQFGAYAARCGSPARPLRDLLELHVVDVLGAWISALRTVEGAALVRWRRAAAADAPGAGAMRRVHFDLVAHCALARLSEIDDIHLGSTTTPGAIVIPGAIAVASALGIRDPVPLAAAMMAGYDVMTRLGQSIGGATVLYRGIWPSYFTAPAAMAAVAARLMGLDAGKTAQALALGLIRAAPGVGHHNPASTARWLAIGQAAESGFAAALAAEAGFTGDVALLDGGFLTGVYGITPDRAILAAGLGERFALEEVSFKPWCAARQTMAATQALVEILATGTAPRAIERVRALVPPPHHRMLDHGVAAGDRSSFLTSLPYRLAVAVLHPDDALDVAQAPAKVAPEIDRFMARVEVAPDEGLMAKFPSQWPARVEVTTAAGRRERVVEHVPGDPQRPYDAAAVQEKFHRVAAPAAGTKAAAQLLECALGLLNGQTQASQLMQHVEEIAGRVVAGG